MLLTGYVAGSVGAVDAADSLNTAISKLQSHVTGDNVTNFSTANLNSTNRQASVVSSLSLVNGELQAQTDNIVNLLLTDYVTPDTSSAAAVAIYETPIVATDDVKQAFAKLQYQVTTNASTISGLSSVYDAIGSADAVLGDSEDTYEDNTVYGVKAYTDHQIGNISITYTPQIEDPENPGEMIDDTENSVTKTLPELFEYIKELEARIDALEQASA